MQGRPNLSTAPPLPDPARRRVLVVDDSRVQRKILQASLGRWGYEVDEAATGSEGLERARARAYDFVLSDWMMPGLTGLEFCAALRALGQETYCYFILLTAKDAKSEVVEGLQVGADDFLAKPVNAAELRARMIAGERILKMERELSAKNRLVSETLAEMSALYAALDRDLVEARKLQMTLVRERERDFGAAQIAVLLRPSGHVGGDLVGYFPLGPRKIAFYAVDVSGHGVTSAMLAARLAGMFAASTPEGNLAVPLGAATLAESWPPDVVAARMNRIVIETIQGDQYFTCIYAVADLATGKVSLVQAGHPHPLILRAGGGVERVGTGGLPIGLVPEASYDRLDLVLAPGDRLLFMSDGLTEAADGGGVELGEDGVARLAAKNAALNGKVFLEALLWDVQAHSGAVDMTDDISAVLFDFRGGGSE